MHSGIKILQILLAGIFFSALISRDMNAQPVPGADENIPFLVTFGRDGETSWGDDDFSQTWFYAVPADYKGKFYIRVFDPDTGGENDEGKGDWNTKMQYSIYGGKGVDPENPNNADSRGIDPKGSYKSGTLLASHIFGADKQYDNKYYTFGPFTATEGDYNRKWGYIFKIICDGISGDDGNLYRYFFSRDPNRDVPIEGANAFTYEYTFRMWNNIESVSHLYPFIDTGVVFVKQKNFDWDYDGQILVVSRVRRGQEVPISHQNDWASSSFAVQQSEIGSSLDFQFHKFQGELIKNNNVVVSIVNQRGDNLPFFSSPIGGVPVYSGDYQKRKVNPPKK